MFLEVLRWISDGPAAARFEKLGDRDANQLTAGFTFDMSDGHATY